MTIELKCKKLDKAIEIISRDFSDLEPRVYSQAADCKMKSHVDGRWMPQLYDVVHVVFENASFRKCDSFIFNIRNVDQVAQ